jgi:capsular exopolysaccharide synthesis family protein
MAKKTIQPTTLSQAEPDEARDVTIKGDELSLASDPRGRVAEQFRGLRNSVVALNPEGAPRSVVLTSSVAGEGKTIATINLGLALAEMPGTEVLLLDGNLHSPGIEEKLGLPRRQGLADVLSGSCPMDSAIRATSVDGVHVMGAGNLPDNPSQLLGSERMRTVLGSLKRRFTYVLIDTPEALRISDASLIGGIADGIVLVVRLGLTPRHQVEQTHNTLEALGGNVLGTCLTGAEDENSYD